MRASEILSEGRRGLNNTYHIIYYLRNKVNGDLYFGVTLAGKDPEHSLKVRWQKHVRRALTEKRKWALCMAIRKYGPENFERGIVEKIRGKLQAHRKEQELVREHGPALNTAVYGEQES